MSLVSLFTHVFVCVVQQLRSVLQNCFKKKNKSDVVVLCPLCHSYLLFFFFFFFLCRSPVAVCFTKLLQEEE